MFSVRSKVLSVAILAGLAGTVSAGPLVPPVGPVTSTMKSLTEVEPRIAINQTNTPGDATSVFVITQPGSYYLTGNVVTSSNKVGIRVLASDVTIDLNGMSIRRGENATGLNGLVDDSNTDDAAQIVTVYNGTITGFASAGAVGINFGGNSSLVIRDLTLVNCTSGALINNGALHAVNVSAKGSSQPNGTGLRGSDGSVVHMCSVTAFTWGLDISLGLISNSVAYGCGIGASVSRSRVESFSVNTTLPGAVGVEASAYCIISGCLFNTMEVGVKALSAAVTVERCQFTSGGIGVQLFGSDAVVRENIFKNMTNNSATAVCIKGETAATRAVIENNQGSLFNFGISLTAAGNTVTGNRFGNPTSTSLAIYSWPTGTRHGGLAKAAGSTSSTLVGASSNVSLPSTMGATDTLTNFYW